MNYESKARFLNLHFAIYNLTFAIII